MDKYNYKLIEYGNGHKELRHYSIPVKRNNNNRDKYVHEKFDIPRISNHSIISSVNRSKNSVYELVNANKWDWFITLTFDYKIVDRTDYDLLLKKVQKWLDNLKQRKCHNLKYLIVPEMHKRIESNGKHAFHFHGVLANAYGITFEPMKNNKDMLLFTKSGMQRYSIKDYKLGYSDATMVKDTFKMSSYICKYITKANCCVNKGKRRYLYSKNLISRLLRNIIVTIPNCLKPKWKMHNTLNLLISAD